MPESRVEGAGVWAAVLQAALDCVIVMDARGLVREFNPAAEATFGWSRSEAVGRPLSELIVPPELRARHNEGLRHYMRSGQGPVLNRRIEIEGVRKDGSRLPVELAIVPFDGGTEQLFAGYLRDLSERVRAQKELQRRNDLAKLLQDIPLAAAAAQDLDEAVLASLHAVRRFMGWPLGHAYFLAADGAFVSHGIWSMGDPAAFAPFRAASERAPFRAGQGLPGRVAAAGTPEWIPDLAQDGNFLRNRLVEQHGLRSGFGFPVTFDGTVRVVLEFFSATVEEPQTDVVAVLQAVGHELGRTLGRLSQEAKLREANERLQALASSRQDFLKQSAHEMGTPLAPVLAQLALLRREDLPPKVVDRLTIIARNVSRLRDLAADLLDAARVEEGNLRVEPKAMDVAEAVHAAVASRADIAAQAGVTLVAVAPAPVTAQADPVRVGQVLDNLLSNALRFTDKGGRVEVRVRSEEASVVVEVVDNGIGLAPEALGRLFLPFSQVHDRAQRQVGGTGLGLFICRGLAHANGGTLEAASAGPGRGSTFTLRLPRSATPA